MAKKPATEKKKITELECILDFCANLSRKMILSGANLERVELAVERICHAYSLEDVSIRILSTYIGISAKDSDGYYAFRQYSIKNPGIHLEKLKKLNRLSYSVVEKKPRPEKLQYLLEEAWNVKEYPDWAILLAQMVAMVCLCFIFGGSYREILPVVVTTAVIHYVTLLVSKPGLDRIVSNAITMFLATIVAILFVRSGLSNNGPVIIITVSMLVIPGIPLVNAVRNLLCGNEMNGIHQLAKALIETLALGAGIYISLWIFRSQGALDSAIVDTITNPFILIGLSFLASVGFGIVFRIPLHDLILAGIGGVITRVALILLSYAFPDNRILYISLAALIATLYAELLASIRKDPSTYFVYPSIVPLIPGDLFYYSLVGMYMGSREVFETNGLNCLLTLLAMSIGFVLSYVISHYIRKAKHVRLVKKTSQAQGESSDSHS